MDSPTPFGPPGRERKISLVLASTDFGLKSQWLDMTSYDHDENFGLYFAVLKKGEPSPLLPESDEDRGGRSAPRRHQRLVDAEAGEERRLMQQPKASRVLRRALR